MSEIQILPAEFKEELKLHFAQAIKAGYPSIAGDHEDEFFDFNVNMVSNPVSTFYGRVDSEAMIEAGINPGDIAVIDKAVIPQDGDLVVAFANNEFVIRFLDLFHEKEGYRIPMTLMIWVYGDFWTNLPLVGLGLLPAPHFSSC